MSNSLNFLAFDLGAESGRAILGRLADGRLSLTEAHRFPNGAVRVPGEAGQYSLHWDTLHLWNQVGQGIAAAAREGPLAGIGVDTWGVDFGLLNRHGRLIGNPYHYRDGRTDGMLEEAFRRVPRAEIFAQTGIQFLQINSLYQLLSMAASGAPELAEAETFLPMPSLFSYWLSGRAACEFSIATTTQCYNPRLDRWATPLLESMGIPPGIFPEIVPTGTVLGPLQACLAEELGIHPVLIIAPACHDTGSAVAAVPAAGRDFAWISSGTWSVMGAELSEPVITPHSLAYDFTNEGGAGHTFRFCKNIMGGAGRTPFLRRMDRDGGGRQPVLLCHRRGRQRIPEAGRYARADPGVLPAHRTRNSERERGAGPLHPGRNRVEVPAAAGAAGGDVGPPAGTDPHRRRRDAEPPAITIHSRCNRPHRDHRPG